MSVVQTPKDPTMSEQGPTDVIAKLREVCADQAEQIADLRAALLLSGRARAVPPRHRWRDHPPTPDEVTEHQWWWNTPPDGEPHILQLDRDFGSGLIFDAGEATAGACAPPFDPSAWPGDWAPCMTPDAVSTRVSWIAEAARRLVKRHVGKVSAMSARQREVVREAFETGFAIGLERGHDTAQVRAEVTQDMVSEDFAVRDRALEDHMAGLAARVDELREPTP